MTAAPDLRDSLHGGFPSSRSWERRPPAGAPAVASARRYLRDALPAVYQREDFGLRFVSGLEEVLDPILAVLDNLAAYVSPDLAPEDMLELLAAWLGVEVDETWSEVRRRAAVRAGPALARERGTRAGLERTLRLAFPLLPLRVEDHGGVDRPGAGGAAAGAPGFTVYCDAPLDADTAREVGHVVARARPAHVPFSVVAAPAGP